MKLKNKSFTLVEILIASALSIVLFGSAYGAFITTKTIFSPNMEVADLQRNINVVIQRIVRGEKEASNISGLRSARSFVIPVVVPAGSELDFTDSTGATRKYFLNGKSIMYNSSALNPSQKTVYTAPANSTLTLRFWEPAGYIDHETVGIYISVSKQAGGRTISGCASTYVRLRNVSK